ncbi:MAG: hypothetical protein GEV13_11405 [Rhodospirillales bacterium]|nr:hypothetical protein [Rhodospirillales bacterium]
MVDRQTFNAQLWPEVIVEDRNLTVHISALRKALGGGCIETVAKSGYRLALPVRAVNGQASSESLQAQREARYQLSQAERVPALKALGLFERAQALHALERCVDERADNAPFIAEFPPFRPLRGEPRFDRLLATIGLLNPLPATSP